MISICIVVLDNFKYLRDCVKSIEKNTKVEHEILVLDLGDDGTSMWCKENKIKVWKKQLPCFYSEANNFLATQAKGDKILFMNPDTLAYPEFLEHMDKDDGDVVGPRIMYPNGMVQQSGIVWDDQETHPTDKYYLSRMEPELLLSKNVLAVSGACLLIKKPVFDRLHGFFEGFRNGYEDVDLCMRAKKKGYNVRFVGRAEITHFQGRAGGTFGDTPTAMEFLDDNLKLLQKRHRKHEYNHKITHNKMAWQQKLLIGTPATGNVRMEWVAARYGTVIPTNWSMSHFEPIIPTYAPMNYLVPDAQNLIVEMAVKQKFQWLMLIEQDNVIPPDFFIKMNEYMRNEDTPVVSGLYFTKTVPPEPMVYAAPGRSFSIDWKLGDKVWCWGVPTGALLIHCSILNKMYEESPEYDLWGGRVRRVFEAPAKVWTDPAGNAQVSAGTSDLYWCDTVIKGDYLRKAGWSDIAKKDKPFLVDTSIFVWHIDNDGVKYPLEVPERYLRK